MAESARSEAIIIKRNDWRENDSRVVLYTKNFGKISLVARGVKKLGSKLAGHIEPLSLVDAMILYGRSFDYLGSAVCQNAYFNLKNDLNALYFAGSALALFDQLVKESVEDQNLFVFLESWLDLLNDRAASVLDKDSGELLYDYFVLRLESLLGYQPELYHCLNCRQPIAAGNNYFNFRSGGLICSDCQAANKQLYLPNELVAISPDCIKLLRIFSQSSTYQEIKVKPLLVRELSRLAKTLVDFN